MPKGRRKTVGRELAREYAREAREVLDGAKAASEGRHTRLAAIGAVNACIRAADALCAQALGEHAIGEDHREAVALLDMVPDGKTLSSKLRTALQYKSEWGYGIRRISSSQVASVLRAAEFSVREAERRL